ncbi:TPA: hypothetical protein RNX13_001738 [Pasteurella multocida]|nr:hypothetical protein [Pasteurella multocida]
MADKFEWIDGDTVKINGKSYRIGGIDTPETRHEGSGSGYSSSGYLAQHVAMTTDQRVKPSDERGGYGRGLATLESDGLTSNEKLIRAGIAGYSTAGGKRFEDLPDDVKRAVRTRQRNELFGIEDDDEDVKNIRKINQNLKKITGEEPLSGTPLYNEYAPSKRDGNVLTNSLARGVDMMQGNLYNTASAIGDAFGIESLKEFGERGAFMNEVEMNANRPNVGSIDDVHSFGDALTYGIERITEFAPTAAATAATALGTGGVGMLAGVGARGAMLGVGAFSTAQNVGDAYESAVQAGVDKAGVTALLTGTAMGALDTVGIGKVASSVMKSSGVSKTIADETLGRMAKAAYVAKDIGKTVAGSALVEGGTETLQEITKDIGIELAGGDTSKLGDRTSRYLESAVAGGVIGGGFGGAGRAIKHGVDHRRVKDQIDEDVSNTPHEFNENAQQVDQYGNIYRGFNHEYDPNAVNIEDEQGFRPNQPPVTHPQQKTITQSQQAESVVNPPNVDFDNEPENDPVTPSESEPEPEAQPEAQPEPELDNEPLPFHRNDGEDEYGYYDEHGHFRRSDDPNPFVDVVDEPVYDDPTPEPKQPEPVKQGEQPKRVKKVEEPYKRNNPQSAPVNEQVKGRSEKAKGIVERKKGWNDNNGMQSNVSLSNPRGYNIRDIIDGSLDDNDNVPKYIKDKVIEHIAKKAGVTIDTVLRKGGRFTDRSSINDQVSVDNELNDSVVRAINEEVSQANSDLSRTEKRFKEARKRHADAKSKWEKIKQQAEKNDNEAAVKNADRNLEKVQGIFDTIKSEYDAAKTRLKEAQDYRTEFRVNNPRKLVDMSRLAKSAQKTIKSDLKERFTNSDVLETKTKQFDELVVSGSVDALTSFIKINSRHGVRHPRLWAMAAINTRKEFNDFTSEYDPNMAPENVYDRIRDDFPKDLHKLFTNEFDDRFNKERVKIGSSDGVAARKSAERAHKPTEADIEAKNRPEFERTASDNIDESAANDLKEFVRKVVGIASMGFSPKSNDLGFEAYYDDNGVKQEADSKHFNQDGIASATITDGIDENNVSHFEALVVALTSTEILPDSKVERLYGGLSATFPYEMAEAYGEVKGNQGGEIGRYRRAIGKFAADKIKEIETRLTERVAVTAREYVTALVTANRLEAQMEVVSKDGDKFNNTNMMGIAQKIRDNLKYPEQELQQVANDLGTDTDTLKGVLDAIAESVSDGKESNSVANAVAKLDSEISKIAGAKASVVGRFKQIALSMREVVDSHRKRYATSSDARYAFRTIQDEDWSGLPPSRIIQRLKDVGILADVEVTYEYNDNSDPNFEYSLEDGTSHKNVAFVNANSAVKRTTPERHVMVLTDSNGLSREINLPRLVAAEIRIMNSDSVNTNASHRFIEAMHNVFGRLMAYRDSTGRTFDQEELNNVFANYPDDSVVFINGNTEVTMGDYRRIMELQYSIVSNNPRENEAALSRLLEKHTATMMEIAGSFVEGKFITQERNESVERIKYLHEQINATDPSDAKRIKSLNNELQQQKKRLARFDGITEEGRARLMAEAESFNASTREYTDPKPLQAQKDAGKFVKVSKEKSDAFFEYSELAKKMEYYKASPLSVTADHEAVVKARMAELQPTIDALSRDEYLALGEAYSSDNIPLRKAYGMSVIEQEKAVAKIEQRKASLSVPAMTLEARSIPTNIAQHASTLNRAVEHLFGDNYKNVGIIESFIDASEVVLQDRVNDDPYTKSELAAAREVMSELTNDLATLISALRERTRASTNGNVKAKLNGVVDPGVASILANALVEMRRSYYSAKSIADAKWRNHDATVTIDELLGVRTTSASSEAEALYGEHYSSKEQNDAHNVSEDGETTDLVSDIRLKGKDTQQEFSSSRLRELDFTGERSFGTDRDGVKRRQNHEGAERVLREVVSQGLSHVIVTEDTDSTGLTTVTFTERKGGKVVKSHTVQSTDVEGLNEFIKDAQAIPVFIHGNGVINTSLPYAIDMKQFLANTIGFNHVHTDIESASVLIGNGVDATTKAEAMANVIDNVMDKADAVATKVAMSRKPKAGGSNTVNGDSSVQFLRNDSPHNINSTPRMKAVYEVVYQLIKKAGIAENIIINQHTGNGSFSNVSVETKLGPDGELMHVVSLPVLNQSNMLEWTAALGHEIGHLVVDPYINAFQRGKLDTDTQQAMQSLYGNDVFTNPDTIEKFADNYAQHFMSALTDGGINTDGSLFAAVANRLRTVATAVIDALRKLTKRDSGPISDKHRELFKDLTKGRKAMSEFIAAKESEFLIGKNAIKLPSNWRKTMTMHAKRVVSNLLPTYGRLRRISPSVADMFLSTKGGTGYVNIKRRLHQSITGFQETSGIGGSKLTNKIIEIGYNDLINGRDTPAAKAVKGYVERIRRHVRDELDPNGIGAYGMPENIKTDVPFKINPTKIEQQSAKVKQILESLGVNYADQLIDAAINGRDSVLDINGPEAWSAVLASTDNRKALAEFLDQNGVTVLNSYAYNLAHGAAKRMAFGAHARNLDGTLSRDDRGRVIFKPMVKLNHYVQTMSEDDASVISDAIHAINGNYAMKYVDAGGHLRMKHPPQWLRKTMSITNMLGNMAVLTYSGLNNIMDAAVPLMLSGDMGVSLKAVYKMLAGLDKREMAQMARTLGVIEYGVMQNTIIGLKYSDNKLENAMGVASSAFFTANMMNLTTRIARTTAVAVAVESMRAAANNPKKAYLLQPHGISVEDARRALDFIGDGDVNKIFGDLSNLDPVTASAVRKFKEGIYNFVNNSTLDPNEVTDPIIANNPWFQLLTNLKRFFYAFHHILIKGSIGRMLARYDAADTKLGKVSAVGSTVAGAFLFMLPLSLASWWMREWLRDGDPEKGNPFVGRTTQDIVVEGFKRAGMMGLYEIYFNAAQATEYGTPWWLSLTPSVATGYRAGQAVNEGNYRKAFKTIVPLWDKTYLTSDEFLGDLFDIDSDED